MKEIILSDITAYEDPEECLYKAILRTGGSNVTVFLLTESQDEEVISGMRSAYLKISQNLSPIDKMVRKYLKENLNEETLDIYREYRNEPNLTRKDMEDNIHLGIIRVEEDGSAEYDYVYDKGDHLTRLIFRGTSEKDFEFRFSCTEEWEG